MLGVMNRVPVIAVSSLNWDTMLNTPFRDNQGRNVLCGKEVLGRASRGRSHVNVFVIAQSREDITNVQVDVRVNRNLVQLELDVAHVLLAY
jgi:hypothetical protein